jgi:hypothetical protein
VNRPTFIVYVDDAAHALPLLASLATTFEATSPRWLLVACAPRVTHRASKWASHRSRENWRNQWADKLFAQLAPSLQCSSAPADVTQLLARQPLPELLSELQQAYGPVQVVDARRPKREDPTPQQQQRWGPSGLIAGMGSLLAWMLEETLV